jgi:hypothetical protein
MYEVVTPAVAFSNVFQIGQFSQLDKRIFRVRSQSLGGLFASTLPVVPISDYFFDFRVYTASKRLTVNK